MKIPVTVYETATDVTLSDVGLWNFDEEQDRRLVNIGNQLYLESTV